VRPEEARERLRALGFDERDVETLFAHFADAEVRGKLGHGFSRVEWLSTLEGIDAAARPVRELATSCHERWNGNGALGYLTLAAICDAVAADPPEHAKLVVARDCFPTGALGYWVRRLANAGLVSVLTTTSPRRLAHPQGGPALASTAPIAIAIPSPDGDPIVADVSMAKATWGDVLAGGAAAEDVVPFGGEQAHKAFALAVALQLLVDSFVDGYGAFLLVARPERSPVPEFRRRAGETRLPGDA
jgi:LDH2 family malate/lactate/ureidoglycolate dehydrogenase